MPDQIGNRDSGPLQLGYRQRLAAGRVAFAHLVRVWHERNGWSHRVLPALAEALDLGRVHNSQISMLRNGKLASPGPEVFLALGSVNRWLASAAPGGRLGEAALAGLELPADVREALHSSATPVQNEAGVVSGPGELLEVFVGLRLPPPSFDLHIDEEEAGGLSAALALLFTAGRPWRLCRDQLLAAYPVAKRQRRERFAEVIAGQRDYTAAELDAELPDLRRTLAALGVAGETELTPTAFLDLLRQRARQLVEQTSGAAATTDLAEAIRRELGPLR